VAYQAELELRHARKSGDSGIIPDLFKSGDCADDARYPALVFDDWGHILKEHFSDYAPSQTDIMPS